jgi:two-component system OmpR family sensor kinase
MTRRLILWLTAAVVVFWLGAALLGASVMREEFDEVFDSALAETGQRSFRSSSTRCRLR